jgi:hypothetical protein
VPLFGRARRRHRQPARFFRNRASSYRTNLKNDDNPPSSTPNYILPPTIQCYDCHDYHGGGSGRINDEPSYGDFHTDHKPQDIAFGFTKVGTGNMTEDPGGGSVSGYYENKPPAAASTYGADPALRPTNPPYPTDNTNLLKTGIPMTTPTS